MNRISFGFYFEFFPHVFSFCQFFQFWCVLIIVCLICFIFVSWNVLLCFFNFHLFCKIFLSADILGVEFVEDIFNEHGIASSFFCKLCDCKFTDPFAKIMHTKGKRHRFMYKVSHTLFQFMVGLLFFGLY